MGDRSLAHDRSADFSGGAHRDGAARAEEGAMMNRFLPGLAAVLLCTLMAQDTNQQQPPPPGTISGTVTAAGTGTPMKDATVFARRGAQDERSAVTDQSGHFML